MDKEILSEKPPERWTDCADLWFEDLFGKHGKERLAQPTIKEQQERVCRTMIREVDRWLGET